MQSLSGSSYTVRILQDEVGYVDPGMVLVVSGNWNVGGVAFHERESAVVLRREFASLVDGHGVLGIFETRRSVIPARTLHHVKPWGEEFDVRPEIGLLKLISVNDGARTSLQSHAHKDEVLLPLSGTGAVELCGLPPSIPRAMHVRPCDIHRVTGPLNLVEGSTFFPDDVIRHEDDYSR